MIDEPEVLSTPQASRTQRKTAQTQPVPAGGRIELGKKGFQPQRREPRTAPVGENTSVQLQDKKRSRRSDAAAETPQATLRPRRLRSELQSLSLNSGSK